MTSTARRATSAPHSGADWQPMGFVPGLDGIRAIAVIVVVAYHGGWFGLHGGFVGVDVFFTLSGFLITRLLLDEHHRRGGVSMKNFYIRRGLRLLPALFALVAGVWLAAALLDVPRIEDRLGERSLWALSYVANWRDVVTGTHGGPFSHLWSLSVEEQFYVVWPVIVVVMLHRHGVDAVRRLAGGLTVGLALMTVWRHWSGASGFDIYFATHSHGGILLLLGAWLGCSVDLVARVGRDLGRRLTMLGVTGILVISFVPDRFGDLHAGFGYLPIAAASVAVIVGAVADDRHSPLTWAPLCRIGKSSYAIYLWHIPMFAISAAIVPDVDSRIRIVIGTAIAVAISHWLVERPALKLKHRWA
ncbi:MAG: acyltransferase [Acidimicrobiales bacterium]